MGKNKIASLISHYFMKAPFQKAFLFFVLFFTIALCSYSLFTFQKKQSKTAYISNEVRKKFKKQLKGLPEPPFNKILQRKISKEEVELGRMLFNDTILSRNNDVSCATCHLSNHGLADGNRLNFGALGAGGPTGKNVGKNWGEGKLSLNRFCSNDGSGFYCDDPMFRNTLSTINVIYRANPKTDSGLLWDGRFGRLSFQVLLPIHTREEMCGVNPMPEKNNPFQKGGPFFDEPIKVSHSHLFNTFNGRQIFKFNSAPQVIHSVESFRGNGSITYPARNECVAIAVSKVRKVPWYKRQFKKIYNSKVIDLNIGQALAAFVSTHIANKSPYDQFVAGHDSLSPSELKGLAIFMTPAGETVSIDQQTLKGANCATCHSAPFFGGSGFYNLGVRGDDRSSLSKPALVFKNSGFSLNIQTSHGKLPPCHIDEISANAGAIDASPDIGRAIYTSDVKDCFQFRVPVLRNVIETYPYFHHGTETGMTYSEALTHRSFKEISLYALKNAIQYHLRGPIDTKRRTRLFPDQVYFDSFFQIDPLVPPILLDFGSDQYPVQLSKKELDFLVQFIAFGLYDKQAVQKGYLGNDLSHPKFVPSGFAPSITRDKGKQTELPPRGRFATSTIRSLLKATKK